MKKVYIYESHLGGGFYTSSESLDYEDLYCETCGDTDTELGGFESLKDVYYSLINNELYYDKNNYDLFRHTEWCISEYGLASLVNELIAYWEYPIEPLNVNDENKETSESYQTILNKIYEVVMYEDKKYCYEIECFDGDIYCIRVDLLDNLLDLYPEDRPYDFDYTLIERPTDDKVYDHIPVCFYDEYENWKEHKANADR